MPDNPVNLAQISFFFTEKLIYRQKMPIMLLWLRNIYKNKGENL